MKRMRLAKISLLLILAGLMISSFVFVYYHFHLGIKPCQGLPTDAANCGDADFGGIIYPLIGVPVAFVGLVGLVVSVVMGLVRRNKQHK
jgi:hypothetical protein